MLSRHGAEACFYLQTDVIQIEAWFTIILQKYITDIFT